MATVPTVAEDSPLTVAVVQLHAAPDIVTGPTQWEHHNTVTFGNFIRYTQSGTVPNGTVVGLVASLGPAPRTLPATDFQPEDITLMKVKDGLKTLQKHGWSANTPMEIDAPPGIKGGRILNVRRLGARHKVEFDVTKKKWFER